MARIRSLCWWLAPPSRWSRLVAALVLLVAASASAAAPTVILISLDGVPPAAIDPGLMPNLARLAERGVLADRLVPVFPTNTFPNHVTLATGVAPDRHGIVNNVFRDPERGLYRKSDDPTWNRVEPIWSIAARRGVVSASFYWVGSEGPWRTGFGPRYWKPFDGETTEDEKVEQILAWLDLDDAAERPQLITSWFHGADGAGHRFGPGSTGWKRALRGQDRALARLVAGLESRGAFAWATVVVVSDHGMARVERSVNLQAALDAAGVRAAVIGGGGFATVTVEGGTAAVERVVAIARDQGLRAHARADAPPEWRVSNPRFGDVVVLAEVGTVVSASSSPLRGAHGYHPHEPSMAAIFVAAGRGVRPGARLAEFRAVDVAPTVLGLLSIPAPREMEGCDRSKELGG